MGSQPGGVTRAQIHRRRFHSRRKLGLLASFVAISTAAIPVHERPLHRNDLLRADEVLLSGSVRGIERVNSLDGATLAKKADSQIGFRAAHEVLVAEGALPKR